MAGGGSSNQLLNAFQTANAADNAAEAQATTGQAPAAPAVIPAPTTSVYQGYQPISVAALQPQQDTAPAAATNNLPGFQGVYNPFRQAAPTQAGQAPTVNIPGFQGIRSPYAAIPQAAAPTQAPLASQLASQYSQYRQGYADKLNAAQAANQAQLAAAQKAYQDSMAAKKAQAEADAARARAEEAASRWNDGLGAPDYSPWGSPGGGAAGGIADLQKGFQ